jgi:hypothetical protein
MSSLLATTLAERGSHGKQTTMKTTSIRRAGVEETTITPTLVTATAMIATGIRITVKRDIAIVDLALVKNEGIVIEDVRNGLLEKKTAIVTTIVATTERILVRLLLALRV